LSHFIPAQQNASNSNQSSSRHKEASLKYFIPLHYFKISDRLIYDKKDVIITESYLDYIINNNFNLKEDLPLDDKYRV
jgi:hypothetical protein